MQTTLHPKPKQTTKINTSQYLYFLLHLNTRSSNKVIPKQHLIIECWQQDMNKK